MFAPLSLHVHIWSIVIFQEFYRAEQKWFAPSFVMRLKAAKSEERDSRFGLSKQSPLALSASFKRIGVYAGHVRATYSGGWEEWQHTWASFN